MATSFSTNDSPPVTISLTDDGEDIRDSVYAFDIQFCIHDSSVFAFTHVDVLKINPAAETATPWRVVTDSGMVLKLVTGSIPFATIDQAFAAERQLELALPSSMEGNQPTFAAITLKTMCTRWSDPQDPFRAALQSLCPQSAGSPQCASWLDVGKQMIGENVDNGMNVNAALHRYVNNEQDWNQYVGETVVCRGAQDWNGGYLSHVTMPTTLAGYFLYVAKVRLPKTDKGFEDAFLNKNLGTASPEQLVTDWFWNSLLASACNNYLLRVFGPETIAQRGIAPDVRDIDPSGMSYNNLRAVALLYLIAAKALTGALAALSDPIHASQQQSAWQHRSVDTPVEDNTTRDAPRKGQSDTSEWTEYHDSLMNLTGAWFGATLGEVLTCEEFTPGFCRAVAFELRNDVEISVWHKTLKRQLLMLEDPHWDGLFADRKGNWDDLREHRWKPLVTQIAKVEQAIAAELEAFATWREQYPDQIARNPAAPAAWEARPETMAAPIPNEAIDAWTYQVARLIRQAPRY